MVTELAWALASKATELLHQQAIIKQSSSSSSSSRHLVIILILILILILIIIPMCIHSKYVCAAQSMHSVLYMHICMSVCNMARSRGLAR